VIIRGGLNQSKAEGQVEAIARYAQLWIHTTTCRRAGSACSAALIVRTAERLHYSRRAKSDGVTLNNNQ
jgi:hypothetical protein